MSLSYTWVGALSNSTGVIEASPYEITINRFGVSACSMHYHGRFGTPRSASEVAKALKRHPDFPWLVRDTATISRDVADYMGIHINYVGIDPDQNDGPEGVEKFYRLSTNLESVNLEAHPKFESVLVDKYSALFDDDNLFLGWGRFDSEGLPNDLYSSTSWLVPGAIYEERRIQARGVFSPTLLANTGKIDVPPPSRARMEVGGSKRNWMLLGGTVELVGDGGSLTRQWRLSGPRGYNQDVYNFSEK